MSEAREPAILDRIYTIAEVDGACFLARQSGLYRLASSNGAARNLYQGWQPEDEIATLDIAMSPRFPQDGLILAGINGGVARSEDGGATWAALAMRSPAPLVTCLALSPAFASDRRVLAGSYEDGIFLSDDAGQGWAAFNFGLFDHKIFCLALSPDYPVDGVVMAGTSSGLYRSDNGGRLWQDLTMPAGDEAVLSLAFSPEYAGDRTILAGTESQGLLRSLDDGLTWEPFYKRQGAVNAIVCLPTVAGLAIQVDDAVLAYETGDSSWRQVAADAHVVASSEDGSALLLGMADGSVQRVAM